MLVNLGFKAVGLPYDQEVIRKNLDRIDDFYLGEGWYADGISAHCDYYIPFAIHFYSLFYAKLMDKEEYLIERRSIKVGLPRLQRILFIGFQRMVQLSPMAEV